MEAFYLYSWQETVTEALLTHLWSIAGLVVGAVFVTYLKKSTEEFVREQNREKRLSEAKVLEDIKQRTMEHYAGSIAFEQKTAEFEATKRNFDQILEQQKKVLEATSEIGKKLEVFRWDLQVELEFKKSVMAPRSAKYIELWTILEPIRASGEEELGEEDRRSLQRSLGTWYHLGGGAMLSLAAMKAFLDTRDLLEGKFDGHAALVEGKLIREAFSVFRTQMKLDMGVYTTTDAVVDVAPGSEKLVLPKRLQAVVDGWRVEAERQRRV